MPRYLSVHTIACMTRRQVQGLVSMVQQASEVKNHRVLASLLDGRMVCEWEADSKEQLEAYWKSVNIHHDLLVRVEYDSRDPATQ